MSEPGYARNIENDDPLDEDSCCGLEDDEPCCQYCGKPFEDFSDLGCERCDRRHPDYGMIP